MFGFFRKKKRKLVDSALMASLAAMFLGLIGIDMVVGGMTVKNQSYLQDSLINTTNFTKNVESSVLGRYVYYQDFEEHPIHVSPNAYIGPIHGLEYEFVDVTIDGGSADNFLSFQFVDEDQEPISDRTLPGNLDTFNLSDFPIVLHNRHLPHKLYLYVETQNYTQDPNAELQELFLQFLSDKSLYETCSRGKEISIPINKTIREVKEQLRAKHLDVSTFIHKEEHGYQVLTPLDCKNNDMEKRIDELIELHEEREELMGAEKEYYHEKKETSSKYDQLPNKEDLGVYLEDH